MRMGRKLERVQIKDAKCAGNDREFLFVPGFYLLIKALLI